jgi:hypothetical protein
MGFKRSTSYLVAKSGGGVASATKLQPKEFSRELTRINANGILAAR